MLHAITRTLGLAGLLTLLGACADPHVSIQGCEADGDVRVYCDIQTPEDIAALADGRHLLLAHFGHMGDATGSISLFDTRSETLVSLFDSKNRIEEPAERWGDPQCVAPDPAMLSPHGTHLHRLASGPWRYLVVNHAGGRESIELFEVIGEGTETSLQWRGCIEPAPETFINDVVGMDNGDIIYTRMFHSNFALGTAKALFGLSTGELWHWRPETGPTIIPGTEASQPNGLEISADNRHVFANMYMTGEVWKVAIDSGEVVDRAPVANGDNSAWGSDGRLWVATHTDRPINVLPCFQKPDQACGLAFEIVAINPDNMREHEVVYSGRGAPMGAVTIAVPQAGRVYMGSFAGDRMISVSDFR